jgi:2-amino-4-hydroxy-6-hydroxymethyldihydropteridine diphosphokinase
MIKKSYKKRIVFGLGSNLGDRLKNLEKAVLLMEKKLELSDIKSSKIFQNKAMLLDGSPLEWDIDFFNIAVSADVDLEKFNPEKILEIIKNIEKEIGREVRQRWAPREIDIDILLIEDLQIHIDHKLTIPHPGMFKRDFFIKTVAEIEEELLKKLK